MEALQCQGAQKIAQELNDQGKSMSFASKKINEEIAAIKTVVFEKMKFLQDLNLKVAKQEQNNGKSQIGTSRVSSLPSPICFLVCQKLKVAGLQ